MWVRGQEGGRKGERAGGKEGGMRCGSPALPGVSPWTEDGLAEKRAGNNFGLGFYFT